MEEYKIFFKKSVEKDLKKIPKKYLLKILEKIEKLKFHPRPEGSEKLTGQELYRVRQGTYRILYSIQDNELTVWVIKVGHRKEIYKKY
ncbi:MAG: type II toxin-antitoxin system mRNA interferase toxin, RelE/StbE family [Desulforhopalus sp.]|nr:type II toxin-antitoxin system mRNA interferase toxin, RelE/StbE family [Desulforhopalus sp.]